jgi:hypothetical protein
MHGCGGFVRRLASLFAAGGKESSLGPLSPDNKDEEKNDFYSLASQMFRTRTYCCEHCQLTTQQEILHNQSILMQEYNKTLAEDAEKDDKPAHLWRVNDVLTPFMQKNEER